MSQQEFPTTPENAEPSNIIYYLRAEVIAFAVAMETKLRLNDFKGGWQDMSEGDLVERIQDELQELELAVVRSEPAEVVLSEAADVANIAMFIADNNQRLGSTLTLRALAAGLVEQWEQDHAD